jgi:hypothetical protein
MLFSLNFLVWYTCGFFGYTMYHPFSAGSLDPIGAAVVLLSRLVAAAIAI